MNHQETRAVAATVMATEKEAVATAETAMGRREVVPRGMDPRMDRRVLAASLLETPTTAMMIRGLMISAS
jgi:hypothetical protein